MDILKIILIAIVGSLIFVYLKFNNSELAGLSALATGIIILILTINYIISILGFFNKMADGVGVSSELFIIVVKIIAISYLSDFCSSLCSDLGVNSIGEKVNFASKIMIFVLSMPVITNLFNTLSMLIVWKN